MNLTRTRDRRTLKKTGGTAFVSFMVDHILIIYNGTKTYAIFIVVVTWNIRFQLLPSWQKINESTADILLLYM